jgi:hypothetical protein
MPTTQHVRERKTAHRNRVGESRRRIARAAAKTARIGSSVDEFAARNGVGKDKVYHEIAAGRLIARKIGKRTIIFADDEAQWRANLPRLDLGGAKPRSPASHKAAHVEAT